MGHEIRKHMTAVGNDDSLSGDVECDETYIGAPKKGKRGRGAAGKTILFGMVERQGDIKTNIVPNVKKATLQPLIGKSVGKGSTIHTDELTSYKGIDGKGFEHQTVNHSAKQYVNGDCHTNTLEGFWAHLKKGIASTHIHVSPKHLDKYVGEFNFRFNGRQNPRAMFPALVSSFLSPRQEETP